MSVTPRMSTTSNKLTAASQAMSPMAMWAGAFTMIYIACGMALAMVYANR